MSTSGRATQQYSSLLTDVLGALRDLLPEGAVAGSEERVFAGVPAQEMRCVHVFGVRGAAGPDFAEQKAARRVQRAVQFVGDTALFFSRRANQGAQLGLEENFLSFARTQNDDQRDSIFRQFSARRRFPL